MYCVVSAMASAGVIFAIVGMATGQLNLALNLEAYASIGGLALLCTVVAVMLFLAGIKRIGPSQASILSTVEPVGTAALGALLLGEGLGLLQLIGGALVIGAVFLLSSQRQPAAVAQEGKSAIAVVRGLTPKQGGRGHPL